MPEEEMQIDLGDSEVSEEAPIDPTEDMSDDDIAASLGYVTTLSEQMLPQDEEEPAEVQEEENDEEEVEEEPEDKDAAQDEEIADIRKQLEQLLAEENDTETEDTESAE
jgi:hypothetical protein